MTRVIVYGSLVIAVAVVGLSRLGVFRPASGLSTGSVTSAFSVLDVTGPAAGRSICYR